MTAPTDNTPISIINDAYFDAGLIQEGDTVNSEQIVRSGADSAATQARIQALLKSIHGTP